MEIIEPPRLVDRPDQAYLGIQCVTPFRGMAGVHDKLTRELAAWITAHDVTGPGPFILRLNVVDMAGPMDIEVGYLTDAAPPGDDRVRPGTLPAGRYATLTYRGNGIAGNRTLIEWAAEQGVAFDRRDDPAGDRFACRYEAFRTDPRRERRKTRWDIELNFRTA